MKCLDPILVWKTPTKTFYRHFSLASSVMLRMHQLVFNCGKCIFCRKRKSTELAMRCVLHASCYQENCFLTLTYDEKKPEYHNRFEYRDIQLFKKRLRKSVAPKRIELFNVHEYGKNGKKHWHLICFNHQFRDRELHSTNGGNPLYTSSTLERIWGMGFCTIGDVSEASAMYQAQYTQKDFKNGNVTNDKRSHSKHSGIGKPYFLKHFDQILRLGYVPFGSRKIPVPRYFERIAHKHYCHFYDPSAFFDLPHRKAIHRPFKIGDENQKIADLYAKYIERRAQKIVDLEEDWENVMQQYLTTDEKPDFIKSAENALYDLRNRKTDERF